MTVDVVQTLTLFGASLVGGALNSVAGGGSFFTWPALVGAGIGKVAANATSTVALWPGSVGSALGFRSALRSQKQLLWPLGLASALGGGLGAWLLLHTSEAQFAQLVPWLLGLATALFAASPRLVPWLRSRAGGRLASVPVLIAVQLVISIYGGYFGGGMGIVMLAAFALLGITDLATANGLKAVLGSLINGVAVAEFAVSGRVEWSLALLMATAAAAGGYGGARVAQKVPAAWIRGLVLTTGTLLTLRFALAA